MFLPGVLVNVNNIVLPIGHPVKSSRPSVVGLNNVSPKTNFQSVDPVRSVDASLTNLGSGMAIR